MNKISAQIGVWVLIFGILGSSYGQCRPEDVLVRVNGHSISCGEFKAAFLKNNTQTQVIEQKTIEDYLELFINFRLKVLEAINLGLDTTASFRSELAGYHLQLANSFLIDRQVENQLLYEAYSRMQFDIRASHILVSLDEFAPPADTVAAWQRIMQARERIMNGEPFDFVAREVSDDPSARDRQATATTPPMAGNGGDLGYFTVFEMVYPFESEAFNLPVGQVSMPVRTNFGFHLIKVTDRIPAMGSARVAHIMKLFHDGSGVIDEDKTRKEIFDLHERLKAGENFIELAVAYSDDSGSASNQGELPPFSSNRIVPEFVKAISTLNSPGQISDPVRTEYGWHLIKLIEKDPPAPFEEISLDLANRINADERADLSQQVVIDRLKTEYNYVEYPDALSDFAGVIDNSVFAGSWNPAGAAHLAGNLFSFSGQSVTKQDFVNFIAQNQQFQNPIPIETFIGRKYRQFVNSQILSYEKSQLENKYPEFRQIIQEFHDGMLLFEIKDKQVWSKALADTIGLQEFFNRNQSSYFWPKRVQATIYSFADKKHARNARRQVNNALNNGKDHQQIEELLSGFPGYEGRKGVFLKDQEEILQKIPVRPGLSKVVGSGERYSFVVVREVFPPRPQQLSEIRGQVIADYQNYLEAKWVEELRKHYKVEINRESLKSISF
ncbi:MAG TPA: peptidylprolyl isomerase [Bacteroidales bacterium]|nr:peptidylprolyl isomerase [Bacteroidales bacterium]